MKTLLTLAILILTAPAWAAPFLVCDDPAPAEGVTHYDITEAGATTRTPAPLHFDMATTSAGLHDLEVRAVRVDPLWGDLVSDPTGYQFTRPGPVAVPVGVVLSLN